MLSDNNNNNNNNNNDCVVPEDIQAPTSERNSRGGVGGVWGGGGVRGPGNSRGEGVGQLNHFPGG